MKRLSRSAKFKRLFALWGLVLLTGAAAQSPPDFQRLQVVTAPTGTTLTIYTTAPFAETAYRPSPTLLLVDLHNVVLGEDRPMVALPRGPVTSYRLYTYRGANHEQVLRIEIGLNSQAQPNVQIAGKKLIIAIAGSGNEVNTPVAGASSGVTAAPTASAAVVKPQPVRPRPAAMHARPAAAAHAALPVAKPHPAVARAQRPAPAVAAHATRVSGPGRLTGIHVEASPRGVVVLVQTSSPVASWKSFPLHGPERLVIDLPGLTKAVSQEHWVVGKDHLKDIRVGQFTPSVVRIVLDLGHALKPVIGKTQDGLRIVIPAAPNQISSAKPGMPVAAPMAHPRTSEHAANATAAAAVALARPTSAVPAARFTPRPSPAVQPGMRLTGFEVPAAAPRWTPVAAAPVAAPRPTPAVSHPPVAANRRSQALPEATPAALARTPRAVPAAATAPVAAATPQPAPHTPRPSSSQSNVSGSSTPRGQAPLSLYRPLDAEVTAASDAVPYSGQRISLNLKDADIKDFFRLIHEISGLNLVIDPNVKGTVTMVLSDVPWDQALDLVLRNNQLGRELEGNVVRIATMKTLQTEAAEQTQLTQAQEDAVPLVTEVKALSYAKATTMIATLKQFIGKRGDITPDARTNTVIIQATPDKLPLLNRLIARLDQKTPQVEVEARVVAASRNFSRELGVQLGFGIANSVASLSGNPNVGSSPTAVSGLTPKYPSTGGQIPLVSNLPVGAPTSGLGFINATNSYRIDAVLSAAEQKGLGHVLSRPKVITQNNAQAIVQQGVKIPVQTTINNTISVQFFNVTLRMAVTPQITADNTVFLQVDIENDQIDPGIPRIQGIPAIDTQQTTTNVLVQNGATVVVGGVMINNSQNNVQQVPLLGSLPVVGNLFKHTSIQNNSQELLFFLTPRILQS